MRNSHVLIAIKKPRDAGERDPPLRNGVFVILCAVDARNIAVQPINVGCRVRFIREQKVIRKRSGTIENMDPEAE